MSLSCRMRLLEVVLIAKAVSAKWKREIPLMKEHQWPKLWNLGHRLVVRVIQWENLSTPDHALHFNKTQWTCRTWSLDSLRSLTWQASKAQIKLMTSQSSSRPSKFIKVHVKIWTSKTNNMSHSRSSRGNLNILVVLTNIVQGTDLHSGKANESVI